MSKKKFPKLRLSKGELIAGFESGMDYIDEEGCSWDSPFDWFWIGILGGCGCGSSEELAERAFKLLENFSHDDIDKRFSVYDKVGDEILAHWFDSLDLTEHGSSVYGSWLSPKGEKIYKNIKDLISKE
jgi:hypothetical protein